MLLLGLIVEKVAPLILDELAVQLLSKLQNTASLESDLLTTQLSAIENRLETGSLKTGLELLKLGDLHEARREFVRACVANPHSAVARLCLGILLYHGGQQQPGLENFTQAIKMNPFICLPPLIQLSQISTFFSNQPATADASIQAKAPFWSLHLQEQSVLETIPLPDELFSLGRWLPTKGKPHEMLTNKVVKAGPILTIASSGKHIALVWHLLEGPMTTRILSVFEQATGTCLWSSRISDKQLQLISLTYAILTPGMESECYEFFSIDTGQLMTTMKKNTYELTFCPNASHIPHTQEYQRSNYTLKTKEGIYTQARFDYQARIAKTPSSEKNLDSKQTYRKEYEDGSILTDPFSLGLYGCKVTNIWKYSHTPLGHHRFSRRVDELLCRPKINTILLPKQS